MKILVTDDSQSTRQILGAILDSYGTVDFAENGVQAVEKFRDALKTDARYDLVVMDIMMPEMDGHAALSEIRKIEGDALDSEVEGVKAIMLSALDDVDNIMQAHFEDGVNIYITKPIDPVTLIDAMRNMELID